MERGLDLMVTVSLLLVVGSEDIAGGAYVSV